MPSRRHSVFALLSRTKLTTCGGRVWQCRHGQTSQLL